MTVEVRSVRELSGCWLEVVIIVQIRGQRDLI